MFFPVFTWIQWNVCFYLPGKAVVYLVAFHLFFVMFVWSYWMTIFTSPASPSKEVNLMLVNYQMLSLMMELFSLCYLCWNSITWRVCSVSIHKLLGNYIVSLSRQPLRHSPLMSFVKDLWWHYGLAVPCWVFLKTYFTSLEWKILRDGIELEK